MSKTTTIQVPQELKLKLDSFKNYARETYADVIENLIELVKKYEKEELELSNEALKSINEAKQDIKKGRVFSSKAIKKELGI